MAKNIEVEYENGIASCYLTRPTDELKIPSLGFDTEEEAELAVAVAKTLKAYNKVIYDLGNVMPYVLRVLGIRNDWSL